MTQNNNISVLPFYPALADQYSKKWWLYGHVYPLFVSADSLIPFQITVPHITAANVLGAFNLINYNTGAQVVNLRPDLVSGGLGSKKFAAQNVDVVVYPGHGTGMALSEGRYYIDAVVDSVHYYSEVFTVVSDVSPYLKIEWWDDDDFIMDDCAIVYSVNDFKNRLYLISDLAKPEYPFEEEGETRDGYFFPTKQISEKRYRFHFLAAEYLLDVMRFIRMSDHVKITYHGVVYNADTFLITPEWESEGDFAGVEAVFDTNTVAKKIGRMA